MERFGKKNNRYRILVAGSLLLQSVLMAVLFILCRQRFDNSLDLLYFMLLGDTFLINLLATVIMWRRRRREELLEHIRAGKQMERFHKGRQAMAQEIRQEAEETAERLRAQIERLRHKAASEESCGKEAYHAANDRPADKEAAHADRENIKQSFARRRYTANPIVNVVLMEKHLECEEAGIGFAADMFVPAELDIDSYSLSSILANLLDNAIEACLDYQEKTGEQGRILIRSAAKEAYLYLDIVNHCREAYSRRPRREGHGLGLEIVRDTAEKHGGTFTGSYREGKYTASVVLKWRNDHADRDL